MGTGASALTLPPRKKNRENTFFWQIYKIRTFFTFSHMSTHVFVQKRLAPSPQSWLNCYIHLWGERECSNCFNLGPHCGFTHYAKPHPRFMGDQRIFWTVPPPMVVLDTYCYVKDLKISQDLMMKLWNLAAYFLLGPIFIMRSISSGILALWPINRPLTFVLQRSRDPHGAVS